MYLFEIFLEGDDDVDMVQDIRNDLIDILTPLAANGLPFVTVDNVIGKLRQRSSGIDPDRALVMRVLDPEQVKMVDRIEGDNIYFTAADEDDREVDKDQEAQDKEQVRKSAIDVAKDKMKAKNKGPL